MARLLFTSMYDEFCHGQRILVANLKRHGHCVNLVCFKQYKQVPLSEVGDIYDGAHIQVYPDGDYVNSYAYPATEKEIGHYFERIREFHPDIIGMGFTNCQKYSAAKLARRVREEFPNIPLMWGGHHPSTDPEWCLDHVNIVCRGEADTAVLEIAEKIDRKEPLNDVKNLWLRDDKGVVHKNVERDLVFKLDTLPFPDFDPETTFYIDHDRISKGKPMEDSLLQTNHITMTARGCPFSCSFCYTSYMKKLYGRQYRLRERPISHVIEELKQVKQRRGNYYLEILDNVFTLKPHRLAEFAEGYKREIDLPFWCYTHPKCCKDRVIAPLTKYDNLQYVVMGIQSASKNVGRGMFHRTHTSDEVLEATEVLVRHGVRAFYDIITNVPGETHEDCRANLDLLRKLTKPFRVRMTKLSLFPNYDIRDKTKETKFVTHPMYRIWNALYFLAQDIDLTDEEIDTILSNETIREHPEILEKINTVFNKYDKRNYDLGVWYELHEKMLCDKDNYIKQLQCEKENLEKELADIKWRKGFRHFMRLSNILRSIKRKLKS